MLINKDILISNLKENPDEYRKQFPKMVNEIDKVVQKPKCGICIKVFMTKLLNDAGFQQKLAMIFEDPDLSFAQDIQDFVVSRKDKNPIKPKSKVEVFWLYPIDAKPFIESYTEDKMIRSIQTVHVPSKDKNFDGKIMITIHWSTMP